MVSALATGLIRLYQRRVSPHKGFRCAFALCHGAMGCSGYALRVIGTAGLPSALPRIWRRLLACQSAGRRTAPASMVLLADGRPAGPTPESEDLSTEDDPAVKAIKHIGLESAGCCLQVLMLGG